MRRSAPTASTAFDFDGKIVWHAQVPKLDNYHGSAGSPVLYRNTVILYQDHQGQSFVVAFHKQTGDMIWKTKRDARTGWGTPVVIRAGRRDELIVSSQHKVTGYDPATGTELWSVTGNKFEVIPTPVVGHDLVFASSGRAGPTIAIRAGGRGDVTDTHVVWTSPKGAPFVPSAIIVDEQLYMINDMQAVVTSFEATTGKVLFQGRLGRAPREGFSASPVTVDGKVFFTNDDGETFVLKAGPKFELLHVNRLGARTPCVARTRRWTLVLPNTKRADLYRKLTRVVSRPQCARVVIVYERVGGHQRRVVHRGVTDNDPDVQCPRSHSFFGPVDMHQVLRIARDDVGSFGQVVEPTRLRLLRSNDLEFLATTVDLHRNSGFENLIQDSIDVHPQLRGGNRCHVRNLLSRTYDQVPGRDARCRTLDQKTRFAGLQRENEDLIVVLGKCPQVLDVQHGIRLGQELRAEMSLALWRHRQNAGRTAAASR